MRRRTLLGASAAYLTSCAHQAPEPRGVAAPVPTPDPIEPIEAEIGGRVGLYALDVATGVELAHRADERFAMASTFKWALAAAVLARVDRGEVTLGQRVAYTERDLLDYAPEAKAHVAEGSLTVEALADAAVTISDNTAANLLLTLVGGPAGLTRFFRELGDHVTRLDRDEPTLNENLRGDPRDTTSPRAMAGLLRAVLLGTVLRDTTREKLAGWLVACKTGNDRLRAGLPPAWRVGHKTGSGANGAVNDVAIAWPERGGPVIIACYLSESTAPMAALTAAHAEIARAVVEAVSPAAGSTASRPLPG